MENVRIGIIGIGNMGSAHMACISEGRIQGLVLGALLAAASKAFAVRRDEREEKIAALRLS